ncbi:hypothetical protein PG994_003358 [Apiospora phragmitis]|uniref:Ankyrin repeat protein n=1 Tax=Apiospora phragmitis TaxID=2905665 RepID=A0ABR1W0L2_9PEZI
MGASPNFDPSTEDFGEPHLALHSAAYGGDLQICSLLLAHGAAIHTPARTYNRGLYPPWGCPTYRQTPVELAIQSRSWDCAELLLSNGAAARIELVDHGFTALQQCIQYDNFRTARTLLSLGAQLDAYTLKSMYPCSTLDEYEAIQGLEEAWKTKSLDSLDNIIWRSPLSHTLSGTLIMKVGAKAINRYTLKRESAVLGPEFGKRRIPFSDGITARQEGGWWFLWCTEYLTPPGYTLAD